MSSDIKNWINFPLIAKSFGTYFCHKSLSGFPKKSSWPLHCPSPRDSFGFLQGKSYGLKSLSDELQRHTTTTTKKKVLTGSKEEACSWILPNCIQDFEGWILFGYLKANAHSQKKKKKDWLHKPQENRTRQDWEFVCAVILPGFLLCRHVIVCLSSQKLMDSVKRNSMMKMCNGCTSKLLLLQHPVVVWELYYNQHCLFTTVLFSICCSISCIKLKWVCEQTHTHEFLWRSFYLQKDRKELEKYHKIDHKSRCFYPKQLTKENNHIL